MKVKMLFILNPDTRWGMWSASGPGKIPLGKSSWYPLNIRLSGVWCLIVCKTDESSYESSIYHFKENERI
jgi:hypothetical protein